MTERQRVLRESISEGDQQIVLLTLNRPDQLNPLDHRTISELGEAIDEVVAAGEAHVVVITGAGTAFSAGGDLKAYQDLYRRPEAFDAFLTDFAAVCDRLERGPLVSIAMVNGACVAGGLELVLSCDLTLMAHDAMIADGHLRFGQLPGAGGSQRLVRAIGPIQARAWILSGAHHTAQDAMAAGLIAEVVDAQQLRSRTMQLAATIGSYSPLAVRHAKSLLDMAESTTMADRLAAERALVSEYATTSFDATEGLDAFAERRPPRYRGS